MFTRPHMRSGSSFLTIATGMALNFMQHAAVVGHSTDEVARSFVSASAGRGRFAKKRQKMKGWQRAGGSQNAKAGRRVSNSR